MAEKGFKDLLTMQNIGSLVVAVFLIGVAYQDLAYGQDEASKRADKIEAEQQEIKDTVVSIQQDTAVMRNEQKHIKDTLEDIKEMLKGRR